MQEKGLEDKIRLAVESETPMESGDYLAHMVPGRRCPSWKKEFEQLAGTDKMDEVIANTPYSMTLEVLINPV